MLLRANAVEREPPLGELKLAMQCGGSDGHSGISCNPALGYGEEEFCPWDLGIML